MAAGTSGLAIKVLLARYDHRGFVVSAASGLRICQLDAPRSNLILGGDSGFLDRRDIYAMVSDISRTASERD